jgi:uncharacterized membrane protein YeaQ/YmgE (transglycosylase-associated protein family)
MFRVFLVAFLMSATLCFAAQAGAAPAGTAIPAVNLGGGILNGILSGVIGAVLAVLVGRGKSPDPVTGQLPPFDMTMAWETILIGVIVGGVAGYMHKAPADLATFLTTSPLGLAIVTSAEQVWNMIFRHTAPMIRQGLQFMIAGAPANPTAPPPTKPPGP